MSRRATYLLVALVATLVRRLFTGFRSLLNPRLLAVVYSLAGDWDRHAALALQHLLGVVTAVLVAATNKNSASFSERLMVLSFRAGERRSRHRPKLRWPALSLANGWA